MPVLAATNFLGRVDIAVDKVREGFLGAELYEVVGRSSIGAAEEADDVDELTVVFNIPTCEAPSRSTVTVHSSKWGRFTEISEREEAYFERQVMDFPPEMDLAEALDLVRMAGHREKFNTVVLYKPRINGIAAEHTQYLFEMPAKKRVLVDTITHEVRVETRGIFSM